MAWPPRILTFLHVNRRNNTKTHTNIFANKRHARSTHTARKIETKTFFTLQRRDRAGRLPRCKSNRTLDSTNKPTGRINNHETCGNNSVRKREKKKKKNPNRTKIPRKLSSLFSWKTTPRKKLSKFPSYVVHICKEKSSGNAEHRAVMGNLFEKCM